MSDIIAGIYIPKQDCSTCKYLYESMLGPKCSRCVFLNEARRHGNPKYKNNWVQNDAESSGS